MKRFLAFIFLAAAFSSCDDGNLTQVSFDFDDSKAEACSVGTPNFFIYKIQDNRALIVQLPESSFPNRISADLTTQPQPLTINGSSVRLVYREYSGKVTPTTMCSIVPVSSPTVIEEREATAGQITITTTAIKSEPDANGATKIIRYSHALVFTNLVFELGGENSQINEAFTQVIYETNAVPFSNFAGLTGLFSCPDDNSFLFKYKADPAPLLTSQALVLDLSDADAAFLFSSEAGPKTRLISSNSRLTHLFFDTKTTFLTNDYFCTIPTPGTPPITEAYKAENGVENQSGIIEVTTLASDNGYKHTIVLKKIRLSKGSLKVQMGDEFIYGEFETTN